MLTLLAAHGIADEWHLRWHLSYTRALAHYHAIMISEGHLMDWQDEHHSACAAEQRRMHQRAERYLAANDKDEGRRTLDLANTNSNL